MSFAEERSNCAVLATTGDLPLLLADADTVPIMPRDARMGLLSNGALTRAEAMRASPGLQRAK